MRLAAPDAVLTPLLGLSSQSASSQSAAGAALDATFPIAETALDTDLWRGQRTDYFDVTASEVVDPTLRLHAGFVSKDTSPVVTDLAAGQAVPDTAYFVDYEKGLIYLSGTYVAQRRSISVVYEYGFELDEKTNVLQGLPEGVKQGGINLALSYLQLNPANVAKDKAKALGTASINGFTLAARQNLQQFQRPRANMIWPSASDLER